jgi:hypothetical protein
MPLSHAPLSAYVDGNLIVGSDTNVRLHESTFDEFIYMYAVNDQAYELNMSIVVTNGSNQAVLTFYIVPDSHEQLILDGMPMAPGTRVEFIASPDVAVHGHVLRDI